MVKVSQKKDTQCQGVFSIITYTQVNHKKATDFFFFTTIQKYPQPGQQWCLTMCERWTSQSTMRGTRLDGRMVSTLLVWLVQALSCKQIEEREKEH